MPAALVDEIAAERVGVVGKITVAEIVALAGSGFLRTPDEVDDSDPTYFYWGWTDTASGSWQVRRTLRADASKTNATILTDAGYADLAAAWVDRTTLGYV